MNLATRILLFAPKPFSVQSLFRFGEQGAWYDPSNLESMYQDSAGTTPVTAVGQPVGLRLDMRNGGARGVNLLASASYLPESAAYWSVNGGTLTLNAPDASAAYVYEQTSYSSLATGDYVEVLFDYTYTSGAAPQILVKGGSFVSIGASSGPKRFIVPAGNSTTGYGLRFGSFSAGAGVVSNIRMSKLPGNHATQSTSTSRPTLQQDAGGRYYLSYDGVDDGMATASIDFTGTDKMTVFAGVYKNSDAATGAVVELSASAASNAGAFTLFAPSGAGTATYGWLSRGSVIASLTTAANYSAPAASVLTASGDISGDGCSIRVNGAGFSLGADQGTGNYGNYPLYIGRRGGATTPFNGRDYGLIVLGRAATANEINRTERWLASRMGVTL